MYVCVTDLALDTFFQKNYRTIGINMPERFPKGSLIARYKNYMYQSVVKYKKD